MLLLQSTDKIQVVTTTTANIDVHASWADFDPAQPATDRVSLGRQNTKITTAATTDVVPSPGTGDVRNVKTLHISNIHASASNVVTIQHTDGTNVVQLESVTLLAGERIAYREGIGTRLIDAAGMEKSNAPVNIGQYSIGALATTVANATITAAKITGLDMVCGPGTWVFEYFLRVRAATAGVGLRLSVNHTGTAGVFMATQMSLQTNTVDSAGTIDQDVTAAPTVMAGLAQRVKSAAATPVWVNGLDTIASDNFIKIEGLMVVTVSGNLELWHASETATSTTVESGSVLRVTRAA